MRYSVWPVCSLIGWIGMAGATLAPCDAYQVVAKETFESGALPAEMKRDRGATESNARVVDYANTPHGAHITLGAAATICGQRGFAITPDDGARTPCVYLDLPLNRALLEGRGRAVFQADFYLTGEPNSPSQAIMAYVDDKDSTGKPVFRLYRFGVTSNGRLFYSHFRDQPRPLVYLEDEEAYQALIKPAWHRFALVFEGRETILCVVNGQPTRFSPISDSSLPIVKPGVFATYSSQNPAPTYFDNLTVLFNPSGGGVPACPWSEARAGSPFASSPPSALPGAADAPSPSPASRVAWVTSPEEAWRLCTTTRKPIATFFYSEAAKAFQRLEQVLQFDPSSARLVNEFIPLRVDVDTPEGRALVARFDVFKVPCFVIIGTDGRERARVVFQDDTPWPQVHDVLYENRNP